MQTVKNNEMYLKSNQRAYRHAPGCQVNTDFDHGVDRSSRFPATVRTDRQTNSLTQLMTLRRYPRHEFRRRTQEV